MIRARDIESGKLKFILHGDKLKGGWTLVRMRGRARSERADNWLLIKERDEEARPGHGDLLLEEETRSVATGRSMDEIAAKADRVWTRDGEQKPPAGLKGRRKAGGKKTASLPRFVAPQLATLVDQPPEGPEWLHEIKLDGYRMLCRIADGKMRLLTRTGQNWTHRFPALARSAHRRRGGAHRWRDRRRRQGRHQQFRGAAAGAERWKGPGSPVSCV